MAFLSYYMQEQPVNSAYFSLFDHSLDTHENFPPLLEAIDYCYQESESHSPNQDDAFRNYLTSQYEEDEVYNLVSSYQQDQMGMGYNSWRNWAGEYEPCFALTSYWGDTAFSYDNEAGDKDGHANELQSTEYPEEHRNSIVNHYYDTSEKLHSIDDCLWSGCESWFGYETDDHSYYYAAQKPSSYNMDEIEFCEGILGHWPCLIQKLYETES